MLLAGRIVQVSSSAGPSFVAKCSLENQKMIIKNDVCFKEAEDKIIKPYLNIMENSIIPDEKKNDALKGFGLHDSGNNIIIDSGKIHSFDDVNF